MGMFGNVALGHGPASLGVCMDKLICHFLLAISAFE